MVNTAQNVNLHNIIRIPSSLLLLRKTLEKLRPDHDETTRVFGEGESWAGETVACPTFLQWGIDGGALKLYID